MLRFKLLHSIYKRLYASHLACGFLVYVLVVALVYWLLEPNIPTYGEGLWQAYINLFTIGYGDFVPQHIVSRILSVILTAYAAVVIALFTSGLVSYYQESTKSDQRAQQLLNQDKLHNLHKCTKEELEELSRQFKENQLSEDEEVELNRKRDKLKEDYDLQEDVLRQNERKIDLQKRRLKRKRDKRDKRRSRHSKRSK